jgi:hypothetical protein
MHKVLKRKIKVLTDYILRFPGMADISDYEQLHQMITELYRRTHIKAKP